MSLSLPPSPPPSSPVERVGEVLADPWTLLTTGVVGGAAWAVGLAIPVAGAVAVGTFATAAVVSLFRRDKKAKAAALPSLRERTEQAACITALDGYVANIRTVTMRGLAPELSSTAADALRVAGESRDRAYRVAVAIDLLDDGINQNAVVQGFTQEGTDSIRGSIERMASRRQAMLEKLRGAVDQVASMYAQLIEVSTTASTLDVSVDGPGGAVGAIADSLTALQTTFGELERDAATIRGGS